MPATKIKDKDGFMILKTTHDEIHCDVFAITPQNSNIDILRKCKTEDEADAATDEILQSFYDIAETFLQHLSEGTDKVTDFDMIRMSNLVDTLAKMKYSADEMPRYVTATATMCGEYTVTTKSFEIGEHPLVTNIWTGEETVGTILDAVYWTDDMKAYDKGPDSNTDWNTYCEFETDTDYITIFIQLETA